MPLYHYTNQAGLLGIIRNKQIWATHTQYLNDSREFLHAVQVLRHELRKSRAAHRGKGARGIFGALDTSLPEPSVSNEEDRAALREMYRPARDPGLPSVNVFVASFSEVRDSVSQWRAYASSGGFCLGFHGDRLADAVIAQKFYFAQCIYDRREQEKLVHALIEQVLEEIINWKRREGAEQNLWAPGGNLRMYLNCYAPILKDPAFAEEREWRAISRPLKCTGPRFDFREGNSMLIPFYRVPLDGEGGSIPLEEVVIGPTPDPEHSAASVRSFLVGQGLKDVKVASSVVPYRNW